VQKSRSLARIKIRRVTFGKALISRLSLFGGAGLWVSLLIVSAIIIVVLYSVHAIWSNSTIVGLGTFINYVFILLNIAPFYIRQTKKLSITDEQWGIFTANIIVNRITLLVVLPILILLTFFSALLFPKLGSIILFGLTMITLATSIYVQIGYSINNVRDFGNLFSALIGKSNNLIKETDDLISEIMDETLVNTVDKQDFDVLIKLSENDLNNAQVDLETVNFRLAIFAVVVSILLSQQILDLAIKAYSIINGFFYTFSDVSSQVLGFSGLFKDSFTTGIYILLCWYLINIVLSMIYQSSSGLLFLYFNNYRAAYALQQALILSSYEQDEKNTITQSQKRKKQ
jgi:hypothetical protein